MYVGSDPSLRGKIGPYYEWIARPEQGGQPGVSHWFVHGDRRHDVGENDLRKLTEQWGTFVGSSPEELTGSRVWYTQIPAESTDPDHPGGSVVIYRDSSELVASGTDVRPLASGMNPWKKRSTSRTRKKPSRFPSR